MASLVRYCGKYSSYSKVKPSLSSKMLRAFARLFTAIATCSIRLTFMGVLLAPCCKEAVENCHRGRVAVRSTHPAMPWLGRSRLRALRCFKPHRGVVKARAAVGRYGIVTDQGVDGAFFPKGL